jgi:hypothetical protein
MEWKPNFVLEYHRINLHSKVKIGRFYNIIAKPSPLGDKVVVNLTYGYNFGTRTTHSQCFGSLESAREFMTYKILGLFDDGYDAPKDTDLSFMQKCLATSPLNFS